MENIKNDLLHYFKDLTFNEEDHRYFVSGIPIQYSVSAKIKDFCKPFNKDLLSSIIAKKENVSPQDILDRWKSISDKAIKIGKEAHLFGELYAFNRDLRPQSNYDIAIMRFWNDLPKFVKPVICELQMYHKEQLYAGTADIILLNEKTGKLIIGDYKSNADLFKNYKGQCLEERFSHLLDTPFNKYQIQLSYYQILLEQTGYEVSSRKIVWIKPDGNYNLYDCENLTQYLR